MITHPTCPANLLRADSLGVLGAEVVVSTLRVLICRRSIVVVPARGRSSSRSAFEQLQSLGRHSTVLNVIRGRKIVVQHSTTSSAVCGASADGGGVAAVKDVNRDSVGIVDEFGGTEFGEALNFVSRALNEFTILSNLKDHVFQSDRKKKKNEKKKDVKVSFCCVAWEKLCVGSKDQEVSFLTRYFFKSKNYSPLVKSPISASSSSRRSFMIFSFRLFAAVADAKFV